VPDKAAGTAPVIDEPMLSGKPFFTRSRITFVLRRVILPLLVIYCGLAIIATVRDMTITTNDYAAVLLSDYAISEYDYWASPAAFLGAYIPWTYYFNNRNMKVRWFLRAKGKDLERVIKERNCRSIVLVGHGSVNCWRATDMEMTNNEVEEIMRGLPRKKGEWLQLTCGVEDFYPVKMGELVMEKERVYTYGKAVTTYVFVTDALLGFKYLKQTNR
jgi:hypothetical protein